jgi:predicted Zn-dependent protease
MAQVTIYIDAETEKRMQKIIEKSGVSKSKWITDLIREKTANTWPDSVKEAVGSWGDFPDAEDLRKNLGEDVERESL